MSHLMSQMIVEFRAIIAVLLSLLVFAFGCYILLFQKPLEVGIQVFGLALWGGSILFIVFSSIFLMTELPQICIHARRRWNMLMCILGQ